MIDFEDVRTRRLEDKVHLFHVKKIIPLKESGRLSDNLNLEILAEKIIESRGKGREFIWMMGAHPIKLGLSRFVIDLIEGKIITHVAMNGAGMIHDFELAYCGGTSEDVSKNLSDGSFGFADETGYYLSRCAQIAAEGGCGLGEEVGQTIGDLESKNKRESILYNSYKNEIRATVHTAIGAETIYQHPDCDAGAFGQASYNDFKILADSISKLEGGVIANVGSAVVLPEVFLKAFSITRNLGFDVKNFTAANLDMINHYRPRTNVVERPTALGGEGFVIIERHEKSIPTLHYLLTNRKGK